MAKTSDAGYAERIIGAFDRFNPVTELTTKPIVSVPTQIVGALADAGLPHRQSVIQGLRRGRDSRRRIGQKVGIATVESRCDRIGRKLEQAEQLLAIVDRNSS